MKTSFIQQYIKFHASTTIIARGEKLYNSSAIQIADVNIDNDEANFTVQGTKLYNVRIIGLASNNIFTSCSCPYDWSSTCKHVVAVLLYLDNKDYKKPSLSKNIKSSKTKTIRYPSLRSRASEKYEITEYKPLRADYILDNISKREKYKLEYNDYEIEQYHIDPKSIVFRVKDYYDYRSVDVKIWCNSSGAVYSKTNLSTYTKYLTVFEAAVLLHIANSKFPNFLDMNFGDSRKASEESYMKNFGFGKDAFFDDYFRLTLSLEKGFGVFPLENVVGILPVNDNVTHSELDFVNSLASNTDVLDIQKKEERVLGFVLAIDKGSSSSTTGNDYKIIPIKGKENKQKTKLISNLDKYANKFNKESIEISDNQKALLELCNDIEYTDKATKLNVWKKIFILLNNEKYVFRGNNGIELIRKKDLMPLELGKDYVDIEFDLVDNNEFIEIAPTIIVGYIMYSKSEIDSYESDYYLSFFDNVLYINKTIDICEFLKKMNYNLKMHSNYKDVFYSKVVEPLSKKWNIRTDKTRHFSTISTDLQPLKSQIYLSEQDNYLIIKPNVVYDNDISCLLSETSNVVSHKNGTIIEYVRNPDYENKFIDFITGLHDDFAYQENNNIFYLSSNQLIENYWFFDFYDKLQKQNIEVFGLKGLKNFKYSPHKAKVVTSVSSGQDWFDVEVSVSFGDTMVSMSDIKKAAIKGSEYIQLKDGSVGILPQEWLTKLKKYFRNGELKKDKLSISKLRFSVIDELFDDIDEAEIISELNDKREKLKNITEIKAVGVPRAIKAKLRPYQKEGLNWLHFLDDMKWGGILADDMGLGKTLQILTFLSKKKTKSSKANLIIVPTTLLFNWQKEIEKFAPHLKAIYYYGTDREKDTGTFSNYDIVFSTYGILVRDIKILKSYKFNYLILDESQSIKNPGSQRFKAASLLKANNRIALTGTPIENSTFDLFAQMTFVNPGFLGTMKSFKDSYSNAIDKEGDADIAAELQKVINPFILRRTKEQVASDLPSKTEDIIYCEMGGEQRKIYDAYKNEYRNKLMNKIAEDGLGKSKLFVLEGLLKLRQICDSPALLKDEEINSTESVKIKEIIRNITDKTANHKILIFSQFTSMLALITEQLDTKDIEYEYLDGSCSIKQRQTSVDNFQKNENLRVFLISLKAGGMGLNLTAADYVFIVDPWWNPAVEEQAIDRCYRIGQDKKVFAYRMICKDTIEEKIMKLQAKKKKISGDLIKVDDESVMKGLKINDIQSLFS